MSSRQALKTLLNTPLVSVDKFSSEDGFTLECPPINPLLAIEAFQEDLKILYRTAKGFWRQFFTNTTDKVEFCVEGPLVDELNSHYCQPWGRNSLMAYLIDRNDNLQIQLKSSKQGLTMARSGMALIRECINPRTQPELVTRISLHINDFTPQHSLGPNPIGGPGLRLQFDADKTTYVAKSVEHRRYGSILFR